MLGKECEKQLASLLEAAQCDGPAINPQQLGVATTPAVHGVRLASGEFVAAAKDFVEELKARGCSAADMEAGVCHLQSYLAWSCTALWPLSYALFGISPQLIHR